MTSVTNIGTIKNIRCSARAINFFVFAFVELSATRDGAQPFAGNKSNFAVQDYIVAHKTWRNWATPEVHVGVAMERSSLGGGNLRRSQEESATFDSQGCEC